jgi:aromatic-L-amino-acid decarboxylase
VSWPLEPDREGMAALGGEVLRRSIEFVSNVYDRPALGIDGPAPELIAELGEPPPEGPGKLSDLLDKLERASAHAYETAGPGYFAYIPGGGLFASAATELYTRVTNRYAGLASPAPALVAMEHSVVRWLAQDVSGLPPGSGGLLTSGGSMANLSAIVAARHAGLGLGGELANGTFYLTEHAHQSVAKAARIAGLPAAALRIVPCTDHLRMDVAAAARMIAEDRSAGLRPFLLVASAGTTNAGTIDPLPELAALARREDLWYHVDGAYGGMFRLTARGRDRLAGIEDADSVTLDPHKTLFIPYGLGALVVRDPARLAAAHESGGYYLQDLGTQDDLPDYAHLGAELTREPRGAKLWLPLHVYGVGAFRDALDEKLDLARTVYDELRAEPALEVPREPELSIVAFRSTGGDEATRTLLAAINASRRIFLSSTVLDGRFTLRVCVVVHRTHADRIEEAIEIIRSAARGVA